MRDFSGRSPRRTRFGKAGGTEKKNEESRRKGCRRSTRAGPSPEATLRLFGAGFYLLSSSLIPGKAPGREGRRHLDVSPAPARTESESISRIIPVIGFRHVVMTRRKFLRPCTDSPHAFPGRCGKPEKAALGDDGRLRRRDGETERPRTGRDRRNYVECLTSVSA